MQKFTGLQKKIIANIRSGLILLLLTSSCFALETEPVANSQPNAVQNQSVPEKNSDLNSSTITPDAIENTNTIVSTTSPITASKPATAKTNSASQLASVIGGLAIIVVLIYGLSWFVKRFAQGGFMQNPGMKVISSMPLGTRERLMLVEVGGKQLLLGVTAAQINTLHVFDEPLVLAEKNQPSASEFSQKLMAIIQKNTMSDTNSQKNSNS